MNKFKQLKTIIKDKKYVHISELQKEIDMDYRLLKTYLYDLKEDGVIFDAGYGWYSTLEKQYELLPVSRVKTITNLIMKNFPYIRFCVWNTAQFQSLYQHTQQHHLTFVETEAEVRESVVELLTEHYRETRLEKKSSDYYSSLDVSKDPVIVRRLITRAPIENYYPLIEKILVDMLFDLKKYPYLSMYDYGELLNHLVMNYRLGIGTLLSYLKSKKSEKVFLHKCYEFEIKNITDFCRKIEFFSKSQFKEGSE